MCVQKHICASTIFYVVNDKQQSTNFVVVSFSFVFFSRQQHLCCISYFVVVALFMLRRCVAAIAIALKSNIHNDIQILCSTNTNCSYVWNFEVAQLVFLFFIFVLFCFSVTSYSHESLNSGEGSNDYYINISYS